MSRSDTRAQDTEESKNVAVRPLEHGFSMELPDLLAILYGGSEKDGVDVQHIIMGALHADNVELTTRLGSDSIIKSLAENAVMNLFLEYPHDRQELVNEFFGAAKCDVKEMENGSFAEEFREGKHKEDWDDWSLPGATTKAETLKFLDECLVPLMVKANCGGIKTHMADDPYAAIVKLSEYAAAVEYDDKMRLGQEFLLMRHSDKPLALFIENTAGDEKSLSVVGILHGSLAKDLDELLTDDSGKKRRVLKMDVAANFEAYKQEYGVKQLEERVHPFVSNFGEDPPDLVYLAEEGVCLTTENTPQYVKDVLESKGIMLTPIGELYSQNTVNEESLVAQETETKDDKSLSLNAFV